MRKLVLGLLLFLFALVCYGQNPTAQTINSGATLPTGCTPSNTNVFILISGGVGTPYYCSAANTWTIWTGGGVSGCTSMGAANTVQKADGAGGCAASSITDNGTTINTPEAIGVGSGVTPAYSIDVSGTAAAGTNNTLRVYDRTAVTGSTAFNLRAGAGQGTNDLFDVVDNAGTSILFNIDYLGQSNARSYVSANQSTFAGVAMAGRNGNGFSMGSGKWICGSSDITWFGTCDIGIIREGPGLWQVFDGVTAGNYRDVKYRATKSTGYAFAGLPTAAAGAAFYCSDCQVTSSIDNTATSGGSGCYVNDIGSVHKCVGY